MCFLLLAGRSNSGFAALEAHCRCLECGRCSYCVFSLAILVLAILPCCTGQRGTSLDDRRRILAHLFAVPCAQQRWVVKPGGVFRRPAAVGTAICAGAEVGITGS